MNYSMKHALILWLSASISIPAIAQQAAPADTAGKTARLLDEVVITGYNTATRKQYTGAATIR